MVATYLLEDDFRPFDRICLEYLFSIRGDEDQRKVKLKNTMYTVPNLIYVCYGS